MVCKNNPVHTFLVLNFHCVLSKSWQ